MDRLGGWITEPSALGVRVVFHSRDDTPVSLYEICLLYTSPGNCI